MNTRGEIRIWDEGDEAYAELSLRKEDGSRLDLRAHAPMAVIRRKVRRALAARGVAVSGNEVGFSSLARRVGRMRALSLLKRAAPLAFAPGGLAHVLAARELMKRRRARRRPPPGKPIGLPPAAADDYEPEAPEGAEEPETDIGALPALAIPMAMALAPKVARRLPVAKKYASKIDTAVSLLQAAKGGNPSATQKVLAIANLARRGNPKAVSAVKTLRVAKQVASGRPAAALPALLSVARKEGASPGEMKQLAQAVKRGPAGPRRSAPAVARSTAAPTPAPSVIPTYIAPRPRPAPPPRRAFSTWRRGLL